MSLREYMRYIVAKLCKSLIIIVENLPILYSNVKSKIFKLIRGKKRLSSITSYDVIRYS